MRIAHIFHHFNDFGGAEEHITALAEIQKASGQDVRVLLIQSALPSNQYFLRLKAAGVTVSQWPLWISRLSGDWDTRENLLRRSIALLTPLIVISAGLISLVSRRTREQIRRSIEGRIRTILKGVIDLRRERQLFVRRLAWIYRIARPDVIHVHSYGAGLEYVLQWTHARHIPTVYQEHSTPDLNPRNGYRLPIDLDQATLVVAVSEASALALRRYCGVTGPIQVAAPITAVFSAHSHSEVAPNRGQAIRIVTIARLSEEKGLGCLIEVAAAVLAQRPAVRFVIYGEGRLRAALEENIRGHHLLAQVILAGEFQHSDLADILSQADIFVLPSLTEGLPLTIVEAMAWGLPIVATTVGGVPDLIADGVNGFLCTPNDANSLAEKILRLIDEPALRAKFGQAARAAFLQSPYRVETAARQYEAVYQQAIQLNGARE